MLLLEKVGHHHHWNMFFEEFGSLAGIAWYGEFQESERQLFVLMLKPFPKSLLLLHERYVYIN
jgi:hypothetical protein